MTGNSVQILRFLWSLLLFSRQKSNVQLLLAYKFSNINQYFSLPIHAAPFAWQLRDGVKEITFSRWRRGEPNDYNNNEACGHYWGSHNFEWNDAGCNMRAAYVCEYKGV